MHQAVRDLIAEQGRSALTVPLIAARAGYNPAAGVTLWQKMAEASKGAPPQFISTHPSGPTRIHDIEVNLPKVKPLYERAPKPAQRFEPPPKKA